MKDIHKQHFFEILRKYRLGTASAEEIKFLDAYYNAFESNDGYLTEGSELEDIKARVKLKVDSEINFAQPDATARKPRLLFQKYYAAAALLFIALSFGTYFIINHSPVSSNQLHAAREVLPGGNKAVLLLANGKKIALDEAVNGEIAKQPGISISKTADGQIVYTIIPDENIASNDAPLYNTILTPKGGQYQVVLPDGTRVWLNSASALKYPSSFTGNQRLVELNGEAYFEVAKNKLLPFRVKTGFQTIEVLGTHFCINAYEDEPTMKTTLLEGAVNVLTGSNKTPIIPGQQASVNRLNAEVSVQKEVNIEKVVAWKNGIFSFENDDLRSIMRQISRWYDVDVIYNGPVSEEKFFGEISRNSNLSQVIKILELNNIHFEVNGKTVRVSSTSPDVAKRNTT